MTRRIRRYTAIVCFGASAFLASPGGPATALAQPVVPAGPPPTLLRAVAPALPPSQAPVVIVGAGLTGLTTAYELRKAGIEVVLLEAGPRAGGRIQTVAFADGTHVEAHMEEYWERSPAYGLLRELKLPLEEDVAHSTVRLAGAIHPYQGEGDRDTYLRGLFSEEEREAFLRWNSKAWDLHERLRQAHFESHSPLPPDLAALQKVSFAAWVEGEGLPSRVKEWIRVSVEPEMAIEWDKIAALDAIDEVRLFLDTPQGFGEKNYHVRGGNTRFVQALVDKIGRGRVVREAQVTAIETTRFGPYIKVHLRVAAAAAPLWTRDGETLLTMLSDGPAGSIYEATAFQATGASADRYLTLLVHARFAQQMLGMDADEMREHAVASLEALFPGIARHVRLAELFVYPTAVAYWPLELGRSRYDALAAELRRPQGRVWIGGDTTENSHSEGAVQAALRMARELVAIKADLQRPLLKVGVR